MVDGEPHGDAHHPASDAAAAQFRTEVSDQPPDDRVAGDDRDTNGTHLSIPAAQQSVAGKPSAAQSRGSAASRAPNAAVNGAALAVDGDSHHPSLPAAGSKSRTETSTAIERTTTKRPVERGCEKQPCHNDADCSTDPIGPRGFSCRCRPGFYGILCEFGMILRLKK
jgi:hypothetical protein